MSIATSFNYVDEGAFMEEMENEPDSEHPEDEYKTAAKEVKKKKKKKKPEKQDKDLRANKPAADVAQKYFNQAQILSLEELK